MDPKGPRSTATQPSRISPARSGSSTPTCWRYEFVRPSAWGCVPPIWKLSSGSKPGWKHRSTRTNPSASRRCCRQASTGGWCAPQSAVDLNSTCLCRPSHTGAQCRACPPACQKRRPQRPHQQDHGALETIPEAAPLVPDERRLGSPVRQFRRPPADWAKRTWNSHPRSRRSRVYSPRRRKNPRNRAKIQMILAIAPLLPPALAEAGGCLPPPERVLFKGGFA
jgi:hypothetical protein